MTTEEPLVKIYGINGRAGEVRELPNRQAIELMRAEPRSWSMAVPDPIGWEFEEPIYRATMDVFPATVRRVRYETPWEHSSSANVWQYADRIIKADEEFASRCWPLPTFEPRNVSARRVLEFFNVAMKSRLNPSPWVGDHVELDDGISGIGQAPTRDAMSKATQRA